MKYVCAHCEFLFDGYPHTDPETGEDVCDDCCPVCSEEVA